MPAIRPSSCVRVARAVQQRTTTATPTTTATTTTMTTTMTTRSFSVTAKVNGGGGSHESQYDPPTGWLFGVKPGEKYQKEGWETPMYWGYCGTLVLLGVAYAFKPDTSIQTWALEEARRRLEIEGILEDPHPEKKE